MYDFYFQESAAESKKFDEVANLDDLEKYREREFRYLG